MMELLGQSGPPSWLYDVCYFSTLIVHVVFMNYVLAGVLTLVISEATCPSGDRRRLDRHTVAGNLRDWMPFALSAAITAGVAPLLFLQVLHQKSFYTANLLLSHRWMFLLPALIAAFYLLYLLKTDRAAYWSRITRCTLAAAAAACILYTAYAWTSNHLVSIAPQDWVNHYVGTEVGASFSERWPRLGFWIAGSFVTLSVMMAWQLRIRVVSIDLLPNELRRLTVMSRIGVGMSALLALSLLWKAPDLRPLVGFGTPGSTLALGLIVMGIAAHLVGWWQVKAAARFSGWPAWQITGGLFSTLVGVSLLRELLRQARLVAASAARPAIFTESAAHSSGGFLIFILFLAINTGLILYCIRLVRKRSTGIEC